MVPEIVKERHEAAEDAPEMETLESDLNQLAQKIRDYRSSLPAQLNSTLLSLLHSQRPFLPQFDNPEQNISREEGSSAPEDPETAKKLKLLNEKISRNCSTMPVVLKRMKDCIARIDKLDSHNDAIVHPAFKRKRTG